MWATGHNCGVQSLCSVTHTVQKGQPQSRQCAELKKHINTTFTFNSKGEFYGMRIIPQENKENVYTVEVGSYFDFSTKCTCLPFAAFHLF